MCRHWVLCVKKAGFGYSFATPRKVVSQILKAPIQIGSESRGWEAKEKIGSEDSVKTRRPEIRGREAKEKIGSEDSVKTRRPITRGGREG